MAEDQSVGYFKGRGAQINIHSRFLGHEYVAEHSEGLDAPLLTEEETKYFLEYPKSIVNKVDSPDIPMDWSMNPYQGCEHGCIYCYARNSHEYWGFSAGLDFERKIVIKKNAAELLEDTFRNKRWKASPIMFSGNTDCYQPVERKLGITRRLLEVLLEYRNPVGMITKNHLILRDKDLLAEMASMNLATVAITITTLEESLRQKLEPRTSTAKMRLKAIEELAEAGIPVMVMMGPVIPGLNVQEIPGILKAAAERGATSAAYTLVRLNGQVGALFKDWVYKSFPDRAEKVLSQIKESHGGKLNESRFGNRMRGEGKVAQSVRDLFRLSKEKYFKGRTTPPFDLTQFRRPSKNGQLNLFEM